MNESRSRSTGVVGDDNAGRQVRSVEGLPGLKWTGRFAVGMLSMLVVLVAGSVVDPTVWAQATSKGAPPSDESPFPPPGIPKDSAPAPPPIEIPKDSAPVPAPAETAKDTAPVPRDEPADAPAASAAPLSARYRFVEKYSVAEDPTKTDVFTQYQVGVVQTEKEVWEKPQGAPDVSQSTRQAIYTERAANVGRDGEITNSVRRYDAVRIKAMRPLPPMNPPLLEGLEIWYHRRPGERPQIFSLSKDRPLRQAEYNWISQDVFVPQLSALFKQAPLRVGDTWRILPQVARLVWGVQIEPDGYELDGTLIEVNKTGPGTSLQAVIGVKGRFNMDGAPNAFNARIHFTFEPTPVAAGPAGPGAGVAAAGGETVTRRPRRDEGIIDARGWITEAEMAQSLTRMIPGSDERLKQTVTRELRLARRRQSTATAGGSNAPLTIPAPPPTADEANSWLVYEDPMGRFQFRHPQELEVASYNVEDPNELAMVAADSRGGAIVHISLQPKGSDPAIDRRNRDPEFHRRELQATWEKKKTNVKNGSADWLPDAEWSDFKRRVYRIEAALIPKAGDAIDGPRLYLDYYVVVLASDESFVLQAMTEQESNLKLRDQAEKIIKSFQFTRADARTRSPGSPPARPQTRPR